MTLPWRRLLHEPLVHFLILGGLLFAVFGGSASAPRETIRIDAATRQFLLDQAQSSQLAPLTPRQARTAIEAYVNEEILVREARRQGYGDAPRIREQLIQAMRLQVAGDIEPPTEDQLRDYYDTHAERFRIASTTTYAHLFFGDAARVPENLVERLEAGLDPSSEMIPNARLSRISGAGEAQLIAGFGRDLARAISAIDDSAWHGPYRAGGGVHFLRVLEHHPGRQPTFEELHGWLEQDWLMNRSQQRLDRELATWRQHYLIDVKPTDDAPP